MKKKIKGNQLFLIACGIAFTALGFSSLFISKGKISPLFFFWAGFYVMLWVMKDVETLRWYAKGGRVGLLIDVVGVAVSTACFVFLPLSNLNYKVCIILNWLFSPIQEISEVLFPYKMIYSPARGIGAVIPYIRMAVTMFLDVLLFVGVGGIIANEKRTKEARLDKLLK